MSDAIAPAARLGLLDRLIIMSGGSPDNFKVNRGKEASNA